MTSSTPAHNQSLGAYGESLAAEYLQKLGYSILERNFKKKQGDIDLVVKEGKTLVVVEVKTRISDEYGPPEDAITARKISMLRRSVEYYLAIHQIAYNSIRIDVIAIMLNADRSLQSLKHFQNIS